MPHKILLVDDGTPTRIGLAALLSDRGYEVIAVNTLAAATRALANETPDLLITDVRLEGYNGLQLVALRPTPVPAIVITGFPDQTLEAEARRMGAEYVLKPVLPQALLGMIRRQLEAAAAPSAFNPVRRWTRKPVTTSLPVRVEDSPARIVDVSYGGLRLEIPRAPGPWLPSSFCIVLPATGVTINADLVWQRQSGGVVWLCGAVVPRDAQPMWREVVDALP